MKKVSLVLIILMASFTSFAQQKNFGTKTIGQWTFEKFPLHYSVTPVKTLYYKNSRTGRLEYYQEFNQLGQINGLKLTMCADGINPNNAIYMFKGEMVYYVTFFPNSKVISTITTYNDKGEKDGFVINRTLKSTGGYTEEVEKYENGVLVEINGIKQIPISTTYKDSLLNGKFKFILENYKSFEGEAENGKLKRIKQTDGIYFIREITFSKDSITVKTGKQSGDGFIFTKLPLISNPTNTNSKLLCKKYGNFNGYPYFIFPQDFNVVDLEELVTKTFPEPFETKVNYSDSLLDGDFQYRQYVYAGRHYFTGYINVVGKAEKGKLTSISTEIVNYNADAGMKTSEKTIKYIFQNGKITQNDYVPELPNNAVTTLEIIIEYPVLLTNSENLGGKFSFRNNFGDSYSPESPNNVLGLPFEREGQLENSTYGYVYFSPFTFSITNLIKIVKTKVEKPFENKISIINGFLDKDFDFKIDGNLIYRVGNIHFIGNANSGVVQKLKIQYDSETSIRINEFGNKLNGMEFPYDTKDVTLSGDTMTVLYILSKQNKVTYKEITPVLKNKRITTSENLSTYDNFIYCPDYTKLYDVLFDLKFIEKKSNN